MDNDTTNFSELYKELGVSAMMAAFAVMLNEESVVVVGKGCFRNKVKRERARERARETEREREKRVERKREKSREIRETLLVSRSKPNRLPCKHLPYFETSFRAPIYQPMDNNCSNLSNLYKGLGSPR